MEHTDHIVKLFRKFLAGNYTEAEFRQLQAYFNADVEAETIKQLIYEAMVENRDDIDVSQEKVAFLLKRVDSHLHATIFKRQRSSLLSRIWISYAAAAIILAMLGVWGYQKYQTYFKPTTFQSKYTEILPGKNQAVLELADGTKIALSDKKNGIIVGERLAYMDGSTISLSKNHESLAESHEQTISTPNGGTYQVTLSDGTRVWLNTSSTLRYPNRFDEEERVVYLTGEAYFEVRPQVATKSKKHGNNNTSTGIPFKVISNDQTVVVLGTAFNVSAYKEKQAESTTLVSGSIDVVANKSTARRRLVPGQQSITAKDNIHVHNVDIRAYIAWREGVFYFDRTPLTDAMDAIGRWYDVDIHYERSVLNTLFYGEIGRNKPLSDVLEMLREGGVNFRVETRAGRHQLVVY